MKLHNLSLAIFALLLSGCAFFPKSELFPGQRDTETRNLRNVYLYEKVVAPSNFTLELKTSVHRSEKAKTQNLSSIAACEKPGTGAIFGIDERGYLATAKHSLHIKQDKCLELIKKEIQIKKLPLTLTDFKINSIYKAIDLDGNEYGLVTVLESTDEKIDAAIMKFDGIIPKNFRPLPLLDRNPIVGEEVAAVGSPIRITNAMSFGNIARQAPFEGGYLFSMPIYPGNSGGALIALSEMGCLGMVVNAVQSGSGQILNYSVVLPAPEIIKLLNRAIAVDIKQ